MENKWYAVMTDSSDNDWGTGSFDIREAEKMVVNNLDVYPDGYIAVIENNTCIDTIETEDFSSVYMYAARIIKAHDWDACRDDIEHLMYWLDMDEEWAQADDMTAENVIRKAGQKIGIDLV